MTYTVHEIFLTQQGEGVNLGRTCVFVRFAGCNLWSGREQDRAAAVCRFCDTEFVGGAKYRSADELADAIAAHWPAGQPGRRLVLTGGEPLMQVDPALLAALKARGFWIAVETNGTQALPGPVDWLCVSPKAGAPLTLAGGDELKLVYPQPGAEPERFTAFTATERWLSPMDGPEIVANTAAASDYCKAHPVWRLNIQAHKSWNIP
ncbi:7-carboxy-7-deazaguanine synthase [Acidisphaera sp. L21]|uniref:7-carboxy-7-deazaguanine synthase n=1 Tax=Acidisphaera sp. L21 TaxID=1641851 RepID=UPI00131AEC10|nr:7-carboxy-7-deazaguanine synthase [Acidisphaera sp. L21]